MCEQSLRSSLGDLPIRDLRFFETTSSTNDEALSWSADGPPDCALVFADRQTAGRGRMGRGWITHPGGSLAFSLILHPTEVEQAHITLFSPLAALALCLTLQQDYGIKGEIKWPNDVLIDRKKVAGVLVESTWLGGKAKVVVIGMGVNVTTESVPHTPDLLFPATSIEGEADVRIDRIALLHNLLDFIIRWRAKITGEEFFAAYQARLAFQGEKVFVQQGNSEKSGIVMGINPNGDLSLLSADGSLISVTVGDVQLRPA